jgi:hypothetical protein
VKLGADLAKSPPRRTRCHRAATYKSYEEIFATRDTLLELELSTELAALILTYAEYWCQQNFSCSVPLRISDSLSRDRPERFHTERMNLVLKKTSCLYLQTVPLGYGGKFDYLPTATPKQVSFRVFSRDEGDNMEMGRIGTFINYLSWLEASIIRQDKSWAGATREEPICGNDFIGPRRRSAIYRPICPRSVADMVCRR